MAIKNNEKKIALEEDQGKAYSAALDLMKQMDNHTEVEVDDYIITVAAEEAEGTYRVSGGGLKWHTPEEQFNSHIEIVVRDKHDRRFLPGLTISAKIKKDDRVVATKDFPFYWHPFLYHYGTMLRIEEEGDYQLEVHIPAPTFPRHDEIKGKRFGKDVNVTIGPIKLEKGRKPHGPE